MNIYANYDSTDSLKIEGTRVFFFKDYNFENNCFFFQDLIITGFPLLNNKTIGIQNNFIQHYNSDGIVNGLSHITYLSIYFRDCLRGEVYSNTSDNYISCMSCPEGKYSLKTPVYLTNNI